jgi:hypothetical protein
MAARFAQGKKIQELKDDLSLSGHTFLSAHQPGSSPPTISVPTMEKNIVSRLDAMRTCAAKVPGLLNYCVGSGIPRSPIITPTVYSLCCLYLEKTLVSKHPSTKHPTSLDFPTP